MNSHDIKLVYRNDSKINVGKLNILKQKGIKAFLICSTGTDHFPVKEALDMGFIVKSVYYGSEFAVATHGFRMLDDLNHLLNDWEEIIFEYAKKEAIIIGSMGRVGGQMAKICRGFGMKVYGHDIKKKFSSREKLKDKLITANFIFLCCDLNESTKDYFSDVEFNMMENHPIIINVVGRLDLIPLKTIKKFINNGTLGGYCCDEITKNKIKYNLKCHFTKHIGWKTQECIIRRTLAEAREFNKLLKLEGKT